MDKIMVPEEVKIFLNTAYDDSAEAVRALVMAQNGDTYAIESLYDEWAEDGESLVKLTDTSIEVISDWVQQQDIKTILLLINGYE